MLHAHDLFTRSPNFGHGGCGVAAVSAAAVSFAVAAMATAALFALQLQSV